MYIHTHTIIYIPVGSAVVVAVVPAAVVAMGPAVAATGACMANMKIGSCISFNQRITNIPVKLD